MDVVSGVGTFTCQSCLKLKTCSFYNTTTELKEIFFELLGFDLQDGTSCKNCYQNLKNFHQFKVNISKQHSNKLSRDVLKIRKEPIEESSITDITERLQPTHTDYINASSGFLKKKGSVISSNIKSKRLKIAEVAGSVDFDADYAKPHSSLSRIDSFQTEIKDETTSNESSFIVNVQETEAIIKIEPIDEEVKMETFEEEKSSYIRVELADDDDSIKMGDKIIIRTQLSQICKNINSVKEQLEKEPSKFAICPLCGKTIETQSMVLHMAMVHKRQSYPSCEFCEKPFLHKMELSAHIKSYHSHLMNAKTKLKKKDHLQRQNKKSNNHKNI